ncbi:MAG: CPBP family intramembrane metalloprotease [Caldisericia bacterium]|nr:CPBP family intramembrane metalloprotease [Caldisericia bacterium]
MTIFDWLQLPLILACGIGLMFAVAKFGKQSKAARNQTRETLINAIGSVLLALPIFYLGFPLKLVSLETLGLDRFVWWWLPASLGMAIVLILLNAGLALGYQALFRIDEAKLVSYQRSSYFTAMSRSRKKSLVTVLFGGILAPLCEELYFRGLLLAWFLTFFNPWIGIAATAIVFGLAHYDSAGVVVTGIIDGIALAILFVWFGSLWIPIMVHIFNNTIGLVAFIVESSKVKPQSPTNLNDLPENVSNDNVSAIMDGTERQDIDEEKVQIRSEQDAAG